MVSTPPGPRRRPGAADALDLAGVIDEVLFGGQSRQPCVVSGPGWLRNRCAPLSTGWPLCATRTDCLDQGVVDDDHIGYERYRLANLHVHGGVEYGGRVENRIRWLSQARPSR
jgi:hypothetical protein